MYIDTFNRSGIGGLTIHSDYDVTTSKVITSQERRPYSLWVNPHNSTPPRSRKVFNP